MAEQEVRRRVRIRPLPHFPLPVSPQGAGDKPGRGMRFFIDMLGASEGGVVSSRA
jgi:hypothetical protein